MRSRRGDEDAGSIRVGLKDRPPVLLDLGLPVPKTDRGPVPAPATNPILTVFANVDGRHRLSYADSMTPDSRAKPPGVMQLLLYVGVGEEIIQDPSDPRVRFRGSITKTPFEVAHDRADNGKIASYHGRWSTRTGLVGPWSIPVGMTIGFVQRGGG